MKDRDNEYNNGVNGADKVKNRIKKEKATAI